MSRLPHGIRGGQESRSVCQVLCDLVNTKRADPGCGQLNCQWDPLDLAAYLRDPRRRTRTQRERWLPEAGPLDKQPDRLTRQKLLCLDLLVRGHGKWSDLHGHLARNAEPCPTGGENLDLSTPGKERGRQIRAGGAKM